MSIWTNPIFILSTSYFRLINHAARVLFKVLYSSCGVCSFYKLVSDIFSRTLVFQLSFHFFIIITFLPVFFLVFLFGASLVLVLLPVIFTTRKQGISDRRNRSEMKDFGRFWSHFRPMADRQHWSLKTWSEMPSRSEMSLITDRFPTAWIGR